MQRESGIRVNSLLPILVHLCNLRLQRRRMKNKLHEILNYQLIILLQKNIIGGILLCHVIQVQVGKFHVV